MAMRARANGKMGKKLKSQRTISDARRRVSLSAWVPRDRSITTPVGAMVPAKMFRMIKKENPAHNFFYIKLFLIILLNRYSPEAALSAKKLKV